MFIKKEGNMGLKKFRKTRIQEEGYINVSVVCSNYSRVNREQIEVSDSTVSALSDYITNPRFAKIGGLIRKKCW